MNEDQEKAKLLKIYWWTIGGIIGAAFLILGGQAVWNGIQQNLSRSPVENNSNAISSNNPSVSSPESSESQEKLSNPFEQVGFPLPNCGDSLPTNPNAYPVNFYPVYIDYSESNLQTVKSNFCGDAYQLTREKTGQKAIQLGSFITLERAKYFQSFMADKFGNAEIGEPTQIQTIPR